MSINSHVLYILSLLIYCCLFRSDNAKVVGGKPSLDENKQICGFLTITLRGTAVQHECMTTAYSHARTHTFAYFNTDVGPVYVYWQ